MNAYIKKMGTKPFPSNLRISADEREETQNVVALLALLSASEPVAQIMHAALHDGLVNRKRKLAEIVGRVTAK